MTVKTITRLTWMGTGVMGAIALSASGAIAQQVGGFIPPSPAQPLQNAAVSEPMVQPASVEQSTPSLLTDQGILTPLEQSIVDEMNLARQNPGFYAELLQERRQYYNGTTLEIPGQLRLLTQEGVAAVDEAIAFLQDLDPLPPLTFSPGMSRAAAEHAADLAPGRIGHVGSDGSLPSTRVSEYGTWGERMGENISYGSDTARDFVLELIIDDGVPSRGHRETLFEADYAYTGVGCDRHTVYRTVCVMTYAVTFQEGDASTTASSPSPSDSSTAAINQPPAASSTSQGKGSVPRYRLGQ